MFLHSKEYRCLLHVHGHTRKAEMKLHMIKKIKRQINILITVYFNPPPEVKIKQIILQNKKNA